MVMRLQQKLDTPSARRVLDAKREYGGAEVLANKSLLRIEADALADEGGEGVRGAGGAPDGEGHFEADCRVFGGGAGRSTSFGRGGGEGGVELGRGPVAAHVEALHGGLSLFRFFTRWTIAAVGVKILMRLKKGGSFRSSLDSQPSSVVCVPPALE